MAESLGERNDRLAARVLDFASNVMDLCERFPRGAIPRAMALQVSRSATSTGANLEEAFGYYSRPDFAHCANISKKEARETRFWLRLVEKRGWADAEHLKPLMDEADQLIRILTVIVRNSKAAQAAPSSSLSSEL